MFRLEAAVAEWREQMVAAGVRGPEVLEELEGHLRDDFQEQVRRGAEPKEAFRVAAERIGKGAVLEQEFAKVGEPVLAQVRNVFFTLAGIPNQYAIVPMNTSFNSMEPRWATYFRAGAFLAPALFLWSLSAVFIIPKLQQICLDSGIAGGTSTFWSVTQSNIRTVNTFREHGVWAVAGLILALVVLEWRSAGWPRYRRAAVGFGTFAVNLLVMVSIFLMILTAVVAAASVLHAGR